MNKVSIITVCYNSEKEIELTLKSVSEQLYSNIEYIIVDGKSSDATLNIVGKYKNIVDILISEKDNGIYDAMNKGVAASSGEWVIFMNSGDCFADKNVLKNIFENNFFDPNVGIIYSDTYVRASGFVKLMVCNNPFWMDKHYIHGKNICHQSSLTRRDLAIRFPFDLSLAISSDFKMFCDIYRAGYKFVYVDHPIAVYEVENGMSKKYPVIAFKESAQILERDHGIRYCYFLIIFKFKTYIHNIASLTIKKYFPKLFKKIKKKKFE